MQLIISNSREIKGKPTLNIKLDMIKKVNMSNKDFLLGQSIFLELNILLQMVGPTRNNLIQRRGIIIIKGTSFRSI